MEKKKISLRGLAEILSEKELKNVMGGSVGGCGTSAFGCGGWCFTAYGEGTCDIKVIGDYTDFSNWLCACYVG
jgi:natural product precursor